jgi:hypothetical protein
VLDSGYTMSGCARSEVNSQKNEVQLFSIVGRANLIGCCGFEGTKSHPLNKRRPSIFMAYATGVSLMQSRLHNLACEI